MIEIDHDRLMQLNQNTCSETMCVTCNLKCIKECITYSNAAELCEMGPSSDIVPNGGLEVQGKIIATCQKKPVKKVFAIVRRHREPKVTIKARYGSYRKLIANHFVAGQQQV
jgi:hypothetical protein